MSERIQDLLDRLTAAIRDEVATLPENVGMLGDEIRRARQIAGMSLQSVADASGLSKPHIWELEQGRARTPTISAISKLARALGIPFLRLAQAALNESETTGITSTSATDPTPQPSDSTPFSTEPHVMPSDANAGERGRR